MAHPKPKVIEYLPPEDQPAGGAGRLKGEYRGWSQGSRQQRRRRSAVTGDFFSRTIDLTPAEGGRTNQHDVSLHRGRLPALAVLALVCSAALLFAIWLAIAPTAKDAAGTAAMADLDVADVVITKMVRGGGTSVSVSGRIIGRKIYSGRLPTLSIALLDRAGKIRYRWRHQPAQAALAKGESLRFVTTVPVPAGPVVSALVTVLPDR